MFFFSRRKKKKDHDNIEDVVEKGTDEENLKGEISGNSEKDETYEKKDDGIRKQMEQEMLTQDKPVTTGKTDAIRFVRNNCEAIAENERQIAEAKKEYEKVIQIAKEQGCEWNSGDSLDYIYCTFPTRLFFDKRGRVTFGGYHEKYCDYHCKNLMSRLRELIIIRQKGKL